MKENKDRQGQEGLSGITNALPEEFHMLSQIFQEEVFELEQKQGKLYVVYMMSDAVESFLVFVDGKLTGEYEKDYEGPVWGHVTIVEDGYVLTVYQGDENCFTIQFSSLQMEKQWYQYHEIGHFWVKDYEYLRQLVYQLMLIRDKRTYFLEEGCNQKERELDALYDFAPLRRYICGSWQKGETVISTEESIRAMIAIAEQAKDTRLCKRLQRYEKSRSSYQERVLSWLLRTSWHAEVVNQIRQQIKEASKDYSVRSFGQEQDEMITWCREQIEAFLAEEKEKGRKQLEYLEEQPFTNWGKEFQYRFHLLMWKKSWMIRKVQITSIELRGNDMEDCKKQFKEQMREIIVYIGHKYRDLN